MITTVATIVGFAVLGVGAVAGVLLAIGYPVVYSLKRAEHLTMFARWYLDQKRKKKSNGSSFTSKERS